MCGGVYETGHLRRRSGEVCARWLQLAVVATRLLQKTTLTWVQIGVPTEWNEYAGVLAEVAELGAGVCFVLAIG